MTKAQGSLSLLNVDQDTIFSDSIAFLMWKATVDVMGVGDLVLLNGFLIQMAKPLNFLGSIYREIRQALTNIDGLLDIS